ncbi:MAG: hypothetical protein AAFW87_06835 [Pseudomonadota bacterium]
MTVVLASWTPEALVLAQSVEARVVQQLRAQGFRDIEVSRTLLGRVRITSRKGGINRETVVNPSTGAILRDYAYRGERPGLFGTGVWGRGGQTGPNGGDDDGADDGSGDDGGDDGGGDDGGGDGGDD